MQFTPETFKTRCPKCKGKIKFTNDDCKPDLSGLEFNVHYSKEELSEYYKNTSYHIYCPGCENEIDVTNRKTDKIMSKLTDEDREELLNFLIKTIDKTLEKKKNNSEAENN